MALKYARDQPAGFINRIEKVAIVGAGGRIGKWIAEALLNTGKHTVTGITRADSPNKLPEGVIKAAYSDDSSLVESLKGQQLLIITMHARANPDAQAKLVDAAVKAGVSYVMPNGWGADPLDTKLSDELGFGATFDSFREQCESLGITWVAVTCGFWYEFSLGGGAARYGFDFQNRSVTFFDDGTTKICTSTYAQVGRAVAAFLSLKLQPDDEKDKAPTISNWDNNVIYMSSFRVSQRDMFESVKRVTGTTDAHWTIAYENSGERYLRGKEEMRKGNIQGLVQFMYTRMFFPNGGGDHEGMKAVDNDILGLPHEDLDESTREGIRRGLAGEL